MGNLPQKEELLDCLRTPTMKLGDVRKLAKEVKMNHDLALDLWESGSYYARLLAILIMDKNELTQDVILQLVTDSQKHPISEREQLADWLMANQLLKSKQTVKLIKNWIESDSPLLRRIYWNYQARLRWMGQIPPDNTEELLSKIERDIEQEVPEVQWAMNFTAGQIGIFQSEYRTRCIELGERTELYKYEKVSKNCTPNYLPLFIAMQVEKQNK